MSKVRLFRIERRDLWEEAISLKKTAPIPEIYSYFIICEDHKMAWALDEEFNKKESFSIPDSFLERDLLFNLQIGTYREIKLFNDVNEVLLYENSDLL